MAIKRIDIEQIRPHIVNGATILVPNLRIKDATNSMLPKEFCNNSEAEIIRSYASNLENEKC